MTGVLIAGLAIGAGVGVLGAALVFLRRNAASRAIATARADALPAPPEPARDAPKTETPAPRPLVFRVFRDGKETESRRFVQATIKLGRGRSMDLCLDGESVSRFHALVDSTAEAIEIVDLGSSAGTFVNGTKVTKARLGTGDTITIGAFRLELTIGS
jgi:pSer/pThr/pTyr-binding forkhead associated (FHA) protein